MKTLIIIPARYQAQRFPGKLLADLEGKSVLARTMERCNAARKADRVVVATDDERILAEVEARGGEGVMTDPDLSSGTERCAEAYGKMEERAEAVIDVQGDEPFLEPARIDQLIELLEGSEAGIATLACPIHDDRAFQDPDRVKLVADPEGRCLYFSRSPIPYAREEAHVEALQHIGIYGFRGELLGPISELPRTPLERTERLEQLRWLEHGYGIRVGISEEHPPGIDNPRDLEAARERIRKEGQRDRRSGQGST
jgi:3-deoxy-manno-octulosonate cytidylyltransferase (CMP-KDO synthetase)